MRSKQTRETEHSNIELIRNQFLSNLFHINPFCAGDGNTCLPVDILSAEDEYTPSVCLKDFIAIFSQTTPI